jgi:hypothetical protein
MDAAATNTSYHVFNVPTDTASVLLGSFASVAVTNVPSRAADDSNGSLSTHEAPGPSLSSVSGRRSAAAP